MVLINSTINHRIHAQVHERAFTLLEQTVAASTIIGCSRLTLITIVIIGQEALRNPLILTTSKVACRNKIIRYIIRIGLHGTEVQRDRSLAKFTSSLELRLDACNLQHLLTLGQFSVTSTCQRELLGIALSRRNSQVLTAQLSLQRFCIGQSVELHLELSHRERQVERTFLWNSRENLRRNSTVGHQLTNIAVIGTLESIEGRYSLISQQTRDELQLLIASKAYLNLCIFSHEVDFSICLVKGVDESIEFTVSTTLNRHHVCNVGTIPLHGNAVVGQHDTLTTVSLHQILDVGLVGQVDGNIVVTIFSRELRSNVRTLDKLAEADVVEIELNRFCSVIQVESNATETAVLSLVGSNCAFPRLVSPFSRGLESIHEAGVPGSGIALSRGRDAGSSTGLDVHLQLVLCALGELLVELDVELARPCLRASVTAICNSSSVVSNHLENLVVVLGVCISNNYGRESCTTVVIGSTAIA